MKTFFKFLTAVLVIATFGLTACSNNDDEPKNNQPVEPSTKNVFSQGLPTESDGITFTTNDKGQVTSIFSDDSNIAIITFEYGEFTRDGNTYDVLMKERDWYTDCDMYIQTNNQGFAIHALEVNFNEDYATYTWDFEYNSDGQMISMKTNSGGSETFKITYTNGDITKVVEDDWEGRHYETIFNYTDAAHPNGIPNKGNIMLYDEIFNVDLDAMDLVYFAGLLGKSTKNLPLERIESNNTEKYNWGLNNNGLPTELNGYTYFSWK